MGAKNCNTKKKSPASVAKRGVVRGLTVLDVRFRLRSEDLLNVLLLQRKYP